VNVRGTVAKTGLGVPLINCVLADKGPSTAIEIGIMKLSGEFKSDKKAAEKKYNRNQSVVVEGLVSEVDKREKDFVRYVLEDPADKSTPQARLRVTCRCTENAALRASLQEVEKGAKIKVMGTRDLLEKDLTLADSKLLK
jgi:hypothetical protein